MRKGRRTNKERENNIYELGKDTQTLKRDKEWKVEVNDAQLQNKK